MLGPQGQSLVGHSVIPTIDLISIEAQMQKRSFNLHNYDNKIYEEMSVEQSEYYPIIEQYAEKIADKYCQRDTVQHLSLADSIKFVACLTYKLSSLAIESKHMEGTIQL